MSFIHFASHFRRAARPAQLVPCPWRGCDPARSPTEPTNTLQQLLVLLPLPPPPHTVRHSAVPPLTTGSDDTATSVSIYSDLWLPKVLLLQWSVECSSSAKLLQLSASTFDKRTGGCRCRILLIWVFRLSMHCCPPQQRRTVHARHAPQKEPNEHGREGAARGTNAFT